MTEFSEREAVSAIRPETTSEERTWAALAHISTLLTLFVGLASAGIGGLLFVFVPLIIYLMYKDKSKFVAYHAAQAFALQIVATIGFFAAILAVVLIVVLLTAITAVLSVILIGLLLIPVVVLVTVVLVLALVAAPFVIAGFSIAATAQTASGIDYRYPYLGRWVADWLAHNASAVSSSV